MSKTAQVVDGEASESESEIELRRSPESVLPSATKSNVIDGEAPESDDETKQSHSRTTTDDILNELRTPADPQSPESHSRKFNFSSLLHQKLWECNVSLRTSFEALLKQTTELAADKLTRADKMLLNVQESMRSVNANMSLARARLKQLETALENANCTAALPTVKIK